MMDTNSTDHEEAFCNANVVMPSVVTPNVVILGVVSGLKHNSSASQ